MHTHTHTNKQKHIHTHKYIPSYQHTATSTKTHTQINTQKCLRSIKLLYLKVYILKSQKDKYYVFIFKLNDSKCHGRRPGAEFGGRRKKCSPTNSNDPFLGENFHFNALNF